METAGTWNFETGARLRYQAADAALDRQLAHAAACGEKLLRVQSGGEPLEERVVAIALAAARRLPPIRDALACCVDARRHAADPDGFPRDGRCGDRGEVLQSSRVARLGTWLSG